MKLTKEEESKLEELCQYAFECARSNDTDALRLLLKSGLNVNLANQDGNTLLMLAAYNGNLQAVQLLLEYGALVDKKNDKALTPLSGVCFKGYYEIAELLLQYGADPNGNSRLSPLNCAFFFGRKRFVWLFTRHMKSKMSVWQRFCAWIYGVRNSSV